MDVELSDYDCDEVFHHNLAADECPVLEQFKELEEQIADLKKRWPAHSLKPEMLRQLEELEEKLENIRSCKH